MVAGSACVTSPIHATVSSRAIPPSSAVFSLWGLAAKKMLNFSISPKGERRVRFGVTPFARHRSAFG